MQTPVDCDLVPLLSFLHSLEQSRGKQVVPFGESTSLLISHLSKTNGMQISLLLLSSWIVPSISLKTNLVWHLHELSLFPNVL